MKKQKLLVLCVCVLSLLAAGSPSLAESDEDGYWDPYEEMQLLQERMARLREENLSRSGRFAPSAYPEMDVEETAEAYIVKAHLPGFEKNQIELEVHGNILKITGKQQKEEKKEKKIEAGRKYYLKQIRFGAFSRSINLPGKFDESAVQAEYKNGVLTVTLPKIEKEPPVKAKKIKVI